MLSTLITGAAVMQAFAVRPEVQAGSMMIARLAETMQENPSDSMAAITAASTIVNNIMLEAGNATEHLTNDNQKTLRDVMKMIRDSMYGSMNDAHSNDLMDLSNAIDEIKKCNANIEALQSPTGALGKLQQAAIEAQHELDRLGVIVDTKTETNNSKWTKFKNHMDFMQAPPACPGLPARTMPTLDVFFEKSQYSIWFAAQKPQYIAVRDEWKAAHAALLDAINAYQIQQAKLDVHYCDWRSDLLSECNRFDNCYTRTVNYYSNTLSPRVQSSADRRIAAYKAGETLIVQIEFLLAEKDTSEVGAVDVSRYTIFFPKVPAKGLCDLSPLESSTWNPPINCDEHQDIDCGGHKARSCGYCPQEHGKRWCNGDCSFSIDGHCVSAQYKYVGCHVDGLNPRNLPKLVSSINEKATTELCHQHCKGFKYFGLQSKDCWCGNGPLSEQRPDSECSGECVDIVDDYNSPAPGCGNTWRNSVYEVLQ